MQYIVAEELENATKLEIKELPVILPSRENWQTLLQLLLLFSVSNNNQNTTIFNWTLPAAPTPG